MRHYTILRIQLGSINHRANQPWMTQTLVRMPLCFSSLDTALVRSSFPSIDRLENLWIDYMNTAAPKLLKSIERVAIKAMYWFIGEATIKCDFGKLFKLFPSIKILAVTVTPMSAVESVLTPEFLKEAQDSVKDEIQKLMIAGKLEAGLRTVPRVVFKTSWAMGMGFLGSEGEN